MDHPLPEIATAFVRTASGRDGTRKTADAYFAF